MRKKLTSHPFEPPNKRLRVSPNAAKFREVEALATQAATIIRQLTGPQTRIHWCGSWIEGTAVEYSDIDLAIDAGRELDGVELIRLQDALEALPTLRAFDLIDLATRGPEIRQRAEATGRPL